MQLLGRSDYEIAKAGKFGRFAAGQAKNFGDGSDCPGGLVVIRGIFSTWRHRGKHLGFQNQKVGRFRLQ